MKGLKEKGGVPKSGTLAKPEGIFFQKIQDAQIALSKMTQLFFGTFFFRNFFSSQSNRHIKTTIFTPKNALNEFFWAIYGSAGSVIYPTDRKYMTDNVFLGPKPNQNLEMTDNEPDSLVIRS